MDKKIFFHVDMDAFYASVEQADNPDLKGKPVIIAGSIKPRSVVSACSYEARKYGVHSAMPAVKAKKLCPCGIFIPARMERYKDVSRQIMDIFALYTPSLIQISIDEAFLDISGMEKYMGKPEEIAVKLKKEIMEKTGLTISVGIAENKYLAKLASEYKKPDGLYRILPGEEETFIDTLKIRDLWGIGKKTAERLENININTTKKLREYPESILASILGSGCASFINKAVRGIDPGIFNSEPASKSISNERTFKDDISDNDIINRYLLDLSHQLMFRLMNSGYVSKTVSLKIRYDNFNTITVQTKKDSWISSGEEIYNTLKKLMETKRDYSRGIRLIGAALLSLEKQSSATQLDLFENSFKKKNKVEKAVLNLKRKNPDFKVVKAALIKQNSEQKNKLLK